MSNETLKVYFDGQCPLCRKEINFYKNIARSKEISWINIEGASFDAAKTGLSKDALKARFHVILNDKVYTPFGLVSTTISSSLLLLFVTGVVENDLNVN